MSGFVSFLTDEEIAIIEQKIGYCFNDKRLLSKAFTHSSFVNENKGSVSNERLEFLGDRVLNLVCAEELFLNSAGDEGKLSEQLKNRASALPLKNAIESMGLSHFLKTSAGLDIKSSKSKAISDLFEAIVAAIYIDSGGLTQCAQFICSHLKAEVIHDYISIFKEWCEKHKKNPSKSSGEINQNNTVLYYFKIDVDGKEFEAKAEKIKEAEKSACKSACDFFKIS